LYFSLLDTVEIWIVLFMKQRYSLQNTNMLLCSVNWSENNCVDQYTLLSLFVTVY